MEHFLAADQLQAQIGCQNYVKYNYHDNVSGNETLMYIQLTTS